jgi:hypothetical protein
VRALVVAGVVVAATTAAAAPARADILSLSAEIDAGGMYGAGTGGAQKANDFFGKNAPEGAYGVLITGELFGLLDAYIQHHQFTDGSNLSTWTQFGFGLHFEVPLGDTQQQKLGKGPYLDAGLGAFFGVGTGQQVMPPLDNAQVSDKAFLAQGTVGFGTHLSKIVDVGVSLPVSWGYFFKNGVAANDVSNHYQGAEGELLGYVRFNLHLL